MNIKATCKMCGAEYNKTNGKSKYCSPECKAEAGRIRAREFHKLHPEYQKNYHEAHPEVKERFKERHPHYGRDKSRRARGTVVETKICVICGRPFETALHHQITCSEECSKENRKRKHRRTPEQEHRKYILSTYGSEEAYEQHLKEQEARKKAEAEQRRAEREAEKAERLRTAECVVCGRTFTTYNPKQKTCCAACSKKLKYARKDKRIPKEQIVDKDITLEALYRRDSGFCYICGCKCDWNDRDGLKVFGKYPTIEHLIPVSRGGLHSWDNVRLACFDCNIKKSDEILPEAEKHIADNAYEFKRDVKPNKKAVAQLSKDGTEIAVYESTAEAARKTGFKSKQIQNCARGEHKTYRGYVWRYI
jgi:predicted nucleic acid-binding Zn ribbon protein